MRKKKRFFSRERLSDLVEDMHNTIDLIAEIRNTWAESDHWTRTMWDRMLLRQLPTRRYELEKGLQKKEQEHLVKGLEEYATTHLHQTSANYWRVSGIKAHVDPTISNTALRYTEEQLNTLDRRRNLFIGGAIGLGLSFFGSMYLAATDMHLDPNAVRWTQTMQQFGTAILQSAIPTIVGGLVGAYIGAVRFLVHERKAIETAYNDTMLRYKPTGKEPEFLDLGSHLIQKIDGLIESYETAITELENDLNPYKTDDKGMLCIHVLIGGSPYTQETLAGKDGFGEGPANIVLLSDLYRDGTLGTSTKSDSGTYEITRLVD